MAVSNKDLINMTESDKVSYIKLRQSLDSFCDVVLAEFDLGEPDADRKHICDFVSGSVQKLLRTIAEMRQDHWKNLSHSRSKDFEKHANDLKESANPAKTDGFSACPPGFIEVDGICVPI